MDRSFIWGVLLLFVSGCLGSGPLSLGKDSQPPLKVGPLAHFTVTPPKGDKGTLFTFDASSSQGASVYTWFFGDGKKGTGVRTTHSYEYTNGVYTVTLVVGDSEGRFSLARGKVVLGSGRNSPPTLTLESSAFWVRVGENVTVTARSSDPDGEPVSFRFEILDAPHPQEGDHGSGDHVHPTSGFDTGLLSQGETKAVRFTTEGTYSYHCHPHPYMKGNITVSSTDPDALSGTIVVLIHNYTFDPENLVVRPNSSIVWVNEDPVPHTATLEKFEGPARLLATSGSSVTVPFPSPGYFEIRVHALDPKLEGPTGSLRILASPKAPPRRYDNTWNGSALTGTDPQSPSSGPLWMSGVVRNSTYSFEIPRNGTLFANLTVRSPLAAPPPIAHLFLRPQGGNTTASSTRNSSNQSLEKIPIVEGTYDLVVSPISGVNLTWTLSVSVLMNPIPTPDEIHEALAGEGHHHG